MRLSEVDGMSPREHAKRIAQSVLRGDYDPLLACRDLADLRKSLPEISDDIMDPFVGVASEVDDLPIGDERSFWSANALRQKDEEAADYRGRVQASVERALRRLLVLLSD
ncbi:MAG: hypothetical protein N2037_14260 [Acidimicrobiales bacterium]|nr:hypothetical protein [Acidimicrobiales bacterium]